MPRNQDKYFIFNGESSAGKLILRGYPDRIRAESRAKTVEIPGRNGALVYTETTDVFSTCKKEISFLFDPSKIAQRYVMKWLHGSGDLVIGDRPTLYYDVDCVEELRIEEAWDGMYRGKIIFDCQPFAHKVTPHSTITLSSSGSFIAETDTPCEALISVRGKNETGIVVNGQEITLNFGTSYETIVIDTGAGEVLNADRTQIQNGKMTGNYPKIVDGINTITILPNISWVKFDIVENYW